MRRYAYVWVGIAFCFVIGFLSVSTAAGAPAGSYSPALRRYPYLTDVVSSSAAINWSTDRSRSSGGVRYGQQSSESCTAHYLAATKTAIIVNGVPQYQWKAQLDLKAGTQYCYRVYLGTSSTGETDLLGSDASPAFRTQVPGGSTQSFSFAVLGDWGQVNSFGTNAFQAKLMSLIASSGARFVVTTGDNGYPAGNQTNFGDLVQTGADISAVFGPPFWKVPGASLPIFVAQGNHGLSSTDTSHPALVSWPENRAVSTSGGRYKKDTYCCLDGTTSQSYPSMWYAFDAGSARFYVLQAAWSEANLGTAGDPYRVDYDYHWASGTPQYKWLKADLAAHASALKFVFLHYPIYSDSPTQKSDTFLQGSSKLEGLLKQNKVVIAFTGHAHIYQRNRASTAGVINYVTGGGGATLGALGTCSSADAYAIAFTTTGKACGSAPVPTSMDKVYHFLKVTVNGTNVTVTPINSLGQPFDVMHYDFGTSTQALAARASARSMPTDLPVIPTQTPSVTPTASATATPTCTPMPTSTPVATNTVTATVTPLPSGVVPQIPAVTDEPTLPAAPTVTPTCVPPSPTNSPTATASATSAAPPTATASVTASAVPTASATPTLSQTAVPTVTPSGNTLTFTAEADAYIDEALPAANFGTAATLQARGGSGSRQISLVRFRVTGMHDTVQDVRLRVFCTTNGSVNGPTAYLADNNWIESGIAGLTWNHQPDMWSGAIDHKSVVAASNWVEYDVSSLIEGDGLYSFALISDSTDGVSLSSREGSNPAQLVVTFER